ncbi:hypothetical protein GYMLUDRAFT_248419 [Collybiopsis luxurians FD-317 M1]|uniref:Unplaced genomic scaffold GYMLUscaffold_55, whole genome shotgun sequence n=1 Tax=Collybiopsis luxurians FD-317 M1 TaxID=944289 RepID=A0A0D0AYP3_9AGAR|nr:hypothetical protein GYMLUDRAFT_248419 [Collybiopsis luxurians FD-317 M1]
MLQRAGSADHCLLWSPHHPKQRMSVDSPFDVDLVTNLVRRQGEELRRVQNELGQSQRIKAASNEALVATERRLEFLHRASSQCHARLMTLTLEFVTLQGENEAMLMELDETLAGIRAVMSLPGSSLTPDAQTAEPSSSFHAIDPIVNTEDRGNRDSAFEESFTDVSVDSSFEEGFTGRDEMEEPQPTSTSNVLQLNNTNVEAAPDVEPVASTNGEAALNVEPVTEPELSMEDEPRPDSEHHEIATGAVSPHPELEIPLSRSFPPGPAATSTAPAHVEVSAPEPSRSLPATPSLSLPPPSGRVASSPAPVIISTAAANSAPGPSRSMPATPSPGLPPPSGRVASSPERVMTSTAAPTVEVSAPGPSRSMPAAPSVELPSSSGRVAPSNVNDVQIRLSTASLKAVCSNLPISSKKKVVTDICTKVFGNTTHLILEHPQALVKHYNSQNQLLITVSSNNKKLCSDLTQFHRWIGHLLLHNTSAGQLYYLGRYGCGPTSRIGSKEYNSLPEETKQYIFDTAKVRLNDIKTEEQLISSMGAAHGIFVAKTELRFPRFDETFDKGLREEARKGGYA